MDKYNTPTSTASHSHSQSQLTPPIHSSSIIKLEDDTDDDDDTPDLFSTSKPEKNELQELLGGSQTTPPFLRKTYEMVQNPETDDVVSWGSGGISFVVWDPFRFSTELLPMFFKHSNFSSFVRQLNTYGFKKVHFDQWEFANAAFQRDKKHLLKSIKRRRHGSANNNPRFKFQSETDIERLKLEQEALRVEIHDLKNQQLSSNESLAAMEERIKRTEWKHNQLLLFIAKAMKNTSLFQQLLQKYKQNKTLESERVFKRRRLASAESLNDPILNALNPNPDCCHEDDLIDIHSEENSLLESTPPIGLGTRLSLTSDTEMETSSADLSSGNYIMWEKLMEDDVICEDQEVAFDDYQTKFVHELEDLIGKPPTWANVGEVACPGGQ
ncbi:hypothetical protein vseg_000307 [Gypsophila vaccaria]